MVSSASSGSDSRPPVTHAQVGPQLPGALAVAAGRPAPGPVERARAAGSGSIRTACQPAAKPASVAAGGEPGPQRARSRARVGRAGSAAPAAPRRTASDALDHGDRAAGEQHPQAHVQRVRHAEPG